eukprot:scaffold609_cov234-Pinguiococcus_pyrenoidosus.AAC.1
MGGFRVSADFACFADFWEVCGLGGKKRPSLALGCAGLGAEASDGGAGSCVAMIWRDDFLLSCPSDDAPCMAACIAAWLQARSQVKELARCLASQA